MTQSLRQRRELHAVTQIGKERPRADWLDPAWHGPDGYQPAGTHGDVSNFAKRQAERAAQAKERK